MILIPPAHRSASLPVVPSSLAPKRNVFSASFAEPSCTPSTSLVGGERMPDGLEAILSNTPSKAAPAFTPSTMAKSQHPVWDMPDTEDRPLESCELNWQERDRIRKDQEKPSKAKASPRKSSNTQMNTDSDKARRARPLSASPRFPETQARSVKNAKTMAEGSPSQVRAEPKLQRAQSLALRNPATSTDLASLRMLKLLTYWILTDPARCSRSEHVPFASRGYHG